MATDPILQMLQQRSQQGPTLINSYQSALSTAAGQDQQSIDQLRGIYSDPSKFERSKLTSFGLGLMAPTANGRLNESMFNGLAAAVETQNLNQERNLSREEKLAGLAALEAKLTRQKAEDTMSVYDKQTGYINNSLTDRNTMADLQLDDNMPGSRPLAPGEEGPIAPDQTPLGRAMSIYNDYNTNPGKYAGPQGQAVVKNAIDMINNERTNATRLQILQDRQNKPYSPDAGSKKQIREIELGQSYLDDSLRNLDRAYDLSAEGSSNSGWGAKWRGSVSEYLPDWMVPDAVFGSPQQGKNTGELAQIMDLEAIKGVGAYLKGPTSDRDVKLMLDTLSDPNATADRKQAAVDRVRTRVKLEMIFNKELQQQLQTGDAYGPGGGIPQEARDWVEEQVVGGADPAQVMKALPDVIEMIQQRMGQ